MAQEEKAWCIVAIGYDKASYIMHRSQFTIDDDLLPDSDLLDEHDINNMREFERQPAGLYRLTLEIRCDDVWLEQWECLVAFPPLDNLNVAVPAQEVLVPIVQQTDSIGQRLRQILHDERRPSY